MGKKKTPTQANPAAGVATQAQTRYESTTQPSPNETQFGGVTDTFTNNYNNAVARNTEDYGNIMGGYNQFREGLGDPTKFSFQDVKANRPDELNESYGYLREAMPGYRDFAATGGYSDKDIQELRARGISPIRSAYGNTMQELDRARSLGGAGGAPNYIAATSRAQRELPEQLAEATTNVNAGLAREIREGRKFGLTGISGTGATMGGLSSQEAGRQLQAAMANQNADLHAQTLSEASLQANRDNQLRSLSGQASLYGTTPGMASTFGNQALNAWNQRLGAEANRNQNAVSLLNAQTAAHGVGIDQQRVDQSKVPWWQKLLSGAGQVAPYVSPYLGGNNKPPSDIGGMGTGTNYGVPSGFGQPGSPGYDDSPLGPAPSGNFEGNPSTGGLGGGYNISNPFLSPTSNAAGFTPASIYNYETPSNPVQSGGYWSSPYQYVNPAMGGYNISNPFLDGGPNASSSGFRFG